MPYDWILAEGNEFIGEKGEYIFNFLKMKSFQILSLRCITHWNFDKILTEFP